LGLLVSAPFLFVFTMGLEVMLNGFTQRDGFSAEMTLCGAFPSLLLRFCLITLSLARFS